MKGKEKKEEKQKQAQAQEEQTEQTEPVEQPPQPAEQEAGVAWAETAGMAAVMESESGEALAEETAGLTVDGQDSHMAEILAIEAAIVPGQYPIMGESSIQVQQMTD